MAELLLGVDIGSYSSKGVLVTPDGEVLASATVEHEMSLPRPGWAEHDADAIWWGEVRDDHPPVALREVFRARCRRGRGQRDRLLHAADR